MEFLRERWWFALAVSSVVGIAAVSLRLTESEAARENRIQETKKKDLRAIASRISRYAKSVRQRFPDGAVVVSVGRHYSSFASYLLREVSLFETQRPAC